MNILAVTTFDDTLQVALKKDTIYYAIIVKGQFKHSTNLVPIIKEICEKNEIMVKDLNLLTITRGPGSFTGLRIGMSALKGISVGLNIPIISFSSLDLIKQSCSFYDGVILPIIDARKQRFYTAIYNHGVKETEELDINAIDIKTELSVFPEILLVGQDAPKFLEEFKKSYEGKIILDCSIKNYGEILIDMAIDAFNKGKVDNISQGPTYIRKSEAEINRLNKEKLQ